MVVRALISIGMLLGVGAMLPGCAVAPPPPAPELARPSERLLAPAKRLPDLKVGDLGEMAASLGACRIAYVEEVELRRGLIAYVEALFGGR